MARVSNVHYTADFRKSYQKLPRKIQNIADRKDAMFRKEPFHPGLRTHKLHGPLDGLWSYWVTRDYRVLFEFVKHGAIFYDIGTHEIYQ